MRILVAIDFSDTSAKALQVVRALGGSMEITLAHVRPPSDVRAAVAEDLSAALKMKGAALKDALCTHYASRIGALARNGERTLVLRGRPATELCKEAAKGYQILAVGTRGRGGVTSALLGSTVQEVLSLSPIPTLVVGEAVSTQ